MNKFVNNPFYFLFITVFVMPLNGYIFSYHGWKWGALLIAMQIPYLLRYAVLDPPEKG